MTTAGLVVGSLSCIVIVSLFICIALALYLGYTQSEEMTKHFKNSSSSITSATHKHSGPYGKMQLVGGISFVLTFPRFFLKQGVLDAEDIRNFPLHLRRKLIALQWGFIVIFISMALLVCIRGSGILD
ncbi:hypothetical protein [Pseudomonas putida]|jgi:hypothetical protein|uniref:hypothetical protein n=1 Tax=Pseudomonas TaxID=286 RepID=UPI00062AFB7D|nr:hypothetical protein [Pseudomonas putida]KKX58351.1 hypothetical protein PU99_24825 [Pseudomonas putida]OMQ34771.1 hypothetical protein BKX96_19745 [Pseudomonas putida]